MDKGTEKYISVYAHPTGYSCCQACAVWLTLSMHSEYL
jgi:hypothetical protein